MPLRIPHLCLSLHESIYLLRLRSAVAGMLILAFGSLSAHAAEPRSSLQDWGVGMSGVENCFGTFGDAHAGFTRAADCAVGQMFSVLSDTALGIVEQYGKAQFGQHFHINRRLGLTASTGTLSADLDVVVPLMAFSSATDDAATRSLFVQNGITRWVDAHGSQRSDLRLGLVHRFRLDTQPDAGILGASMFVQENLELGHQRLVSGLEYTNRWGRTALNHYTPMTDWLPGRRGYEERAIGGLELSYAADLTGTIALDAAAGRWESKDGSGLRNSHGRLGVSWQPHRWFEFRGDWDEIGTERDYQALRMAVTIPLGADEWPHWRGFGVDEPPPPSPGQGLLWNAADTTGQIDVAERAALSSNETEPDQESNSGTMQAKALAYTPSTNSE